MIADGVLGIKIKGQVIDAGFRGCGAEVFSDRASYAQALADPPRCGNGRSGAAKGLAGRTFFAYLVSDPGIAFKF